MSGRTETRRGFFKKLVAGVAVAPVLVGINPRGQSNRAFAQTPTKALDEKDPMAVALGYKHDASQVDKAKFPKYDGKQVCATCILCTKTGLTIEGKSEKYCQCGLFPTGLVAEKGWCNSYAPKPS